MATGILSPSPVFTGFDANGDPLSGGLLSTFLAGTSTPAATYTDVGLTVANANPVVLDSAGRAVLFLTAGQSYKFVLKNAAGATQWSQDNISAGSGGSPSLDITGTAGETLGAGKVVYLSDGSGGLIVGRWYLADSAQAYASTLPVIGMTIAAIANGAVGTIRLNGIVTGLSSLTTGTTYYVGTAGALTIVTTVLSNARLVGVADSITSLVLNPSLSDRPAVVTTMSATGSVAGPLVAPGIRTIIYCTNASLATISQFTGSAVAGAEVWVISAGAGQVDLSHEIAGVGDSLHNVTTSAVTSLSAGVGAAKYVYDATIQRWRMVAHQQGAWITPTFNAANYTASGTMTWVPDAGDIGVCKYLLDGRRLHVVFNGSTMTIGGVVSTQLRLGKAAYGNFLAASSILLPRAIVNDNAAGVLTSCHVSVASGGSVINISKYTNANFTLSTNLTDLYFDIDFDVS